MMFLDDPGSYFAAAELAKWYEHRKHDYEKAIDIVSKTLTLSGLKTSEERNSLLHRLNRLKSRAGYTETE
jgi:hypothetical protein